MIAYLIYNIKCPSANMVNSNLSISYYSPIKMPSSLLPSHSRQYSGINFNWNIFKIFLLLPYRITYSLQLWNKSIRITKQLLTPFILCVLILFISFKPISNQSLLPKSSWQYLFYLNLLSRNRRRNFFYMSIRLRCLTYRMNYYDKIIIPLTFE